MYKRAVGIACILVVLLAAGCASKEFQSLGSSILSSTGLISTSQASALFSAGGRLVKATTPLSEEEEYFLGRSVSAEILTRYKPVRDRELQLYVTKVGQVVVAASGRPEVFGGYHFAVLDSEEVNAFAAPGGFIFITKGLLRLLPDEDALAGVLAHEVGHVALAHGVNAISQSHLTQAATILGKEAATSYGAAEVRQLTSLLGDSVKEVVETVLIRGYSRSQEFQADAYAIATMVRAGYSPQAFVDGLSLINSHQDHAVDHSNSGWYATHPAPVRRIREIGSVIDDDAGRALRARRFKAAVQRLRS